MEAKVHGRRSAVDRTWHNEAALGASKQSKIEVQPTWVRWNQPDPGSDAVCALTFV